MRMVRTVPALPVRDMRLATDFYRERFGFEVFHQEHAFAILKRDEIELHLWAASDEGWRTRPDLLARVVSSGAESFIAGTASCRIEVADGIDELFAEYQASGVLYDSNTRVELEPWGVRDFATLDLERNLLTFYERVT